MKGLWGGFFRFRGITAMDYVPLPATCRESARHEADASPQSTTDTSADVILDGPFAETKEHAIGV